MGLFRPVAGRLCFTLEKLPAAYQNKHKKLSAFPQHSLFSQRQHSLRSLLHSKSSLVSHILHTGGKTPMVFSLYLHTTHVSHDDVSLNSFTHINNTEVDVMHLPWNRNTYISSVARKLHDTFHLSTYTRDYSSISAYQRALKIAIRIAETRWSSHLYM